jgi:site-specific DNA-adenine methylase
MLVGKADFNKSIRKKLASFKRSVKNKDIEFIHSDFKVIKELDLHKNDFVYINSSYLITNTVYSESDSKWDKICSIKCIEKR